MYEDRQDVLQEKLSDYKIEVELNYNTLMNSENTIKPFFIHKDKYIFSPYTQFQIAKIETASNFKIITLKYITNVEFMSFIFQDSLIKNEENLIGVYQKIVSCENGYDHLSNDENIKIIKHNYMRILSLEMYRNGESDKAIEMHKKIIGEAEE